jgi:hypothetical protein
MSDSPDRATLPASAPTAPQPGEQTELRIEQPVRLDDAEPVETPQQEETPPEVRPPGRHDTQMDGIVARRRERLARELEEARAQGFPSDPQEAGAPTGPVPPVPGTAPAVEAAPTPISPEATSPPSAGEGAASPQIRRHRVMVRGQQFELADDEIRRAAELGIESEARLRHAEQMMQQAQQLAAQAAQMQQPQPQYDPRAGQSPPAAAPPQQQPPQNDAVLQTLAKELLYGDEDRVAAALGQVMNYRQQQAQPAPQLDPNVLAQEVYNRIDQRFTVENALQQFARTYPDIVGDPSKSLLCANYVIALREHYRQIQTPRSEWDLYVEGAERTRQDINNWVGQSQPQQPQQRPAQQPSNPSPNLNMQNGNRLTIKRNMPQAPSAAAAQAAPQERPAPSNRDIINQMRVARGQPPLPPIH